MTEEESGWGILIADQYFSKTPKFTSSTARVLGIIPG